MIQTIKIFFREHKILLINFFLIVIFWCILFFRSPSKRVQNVLSDFGINNYLIYEETRFVDFSDLLNILSILLASYIIPKAIQDSQKKEQFTENHLLSILKQFEDVFHDLNHLVADVQINNSMKEEAEKKILLLSKTMGFILNQLENANKRLGGESQKIEAFKTDYFQFLDIFGRLGEDRFSFDQEFKSAFEVSFWDFQSKIYILKEAIVIP